MDTQFSHETPNSVTLTDGNGRTFDVDAQSVDDLLMLAALTRQTPHEVFATAVERERTAALTKKAAVTSAPQAGTSAASAARRRAAAASQGN